MFWTAHMLAALLLLGQADGAASDEQLNAAISAYGDMEDERAHALLVKVLARKPPDPVAARAYLYLGLIDFNGLDAVKARREFRHALELDPSVEPPSVSSAKAQRLFAEARRSLYGAPNRAAVPPAAVKVAPAPEAVGHSHALGWALGAGGIVSGGVAVYGLTQVLSYNSLANRANAKQGAVGSDQIAGPLSSAKVWQPLSIALGAVGVGLLLAAVFTW